MKRPDKSSASFLPANPFKKNIWIVLAAGILLLIVYYAIFGQFLPNKNEHMGHDYSFFLPTLLDGYFWYRTNGLMGIPWFTPSFCGGSLNYININNGFYTVPQFFVFFTDPITSVRLTFLCFAAAGFCGFYLLMRRAFHTTQPVSFFGAGLFLFNGFYAHRMLIGHLCFHPFMLIPFIALVLLRPLPEKKKNRLWQFTFDLAIAGCMFAYMVQSGFSSLMPPAIISIVMIGLIRGLLYGGYRHFWARFFGAGILGVLLCLSKLTAVFFLMGRFPRSSYTLPGAKNFFDATWLVLKSLFVSPAFDSGRGELLINVQWFLDRHEWEYSVTFIPMVIMLYGGWKVLQEIRNKRFLLSLSWTKWLHVGAISAFLVLPVVLNTYSPGWNTFLKQIPLIKNSSRLIHWINIYIPVVILIAATVLEKTVTSYKYQIGIVAVSMIALININAFTNRDFYHRQEYDPEEVVTAYHEVESGIWTPEIKNIGVYVDKKGQAIMPGFRNNMLVHGTSQLLCYESMFGYKLEAFPIKTLHPGPALEEKDGMLNVKNPACYVWPEANNCEPGDHFSVEQLQKAVNFLNYRPFRFQIPIVQKAANWANFIALILTLFFGIACTVRALILSLKG